VGYAILGKKMKTKKMSDIAEIRLQLQGMARTARALRARAFLPANRQALASVAGICRSLLSRLAP